MIEEENGLEIKKKILREDIARNKVFIDGLTLKNSYLLSELAALETKSQNLFGASEPQK